MQQSGKLNGNEITISVRNLVEFILRSGDIKAGTGTMADPEVMQMGSRMHRKLQKSGGKNYQAEVPLSRTVDCGDYKITIEGRADGIITAAQPSGSPDEAQKDAAAQPSGSPDEAQKDAAAQPSGNPNEAQKDAAAQPDATVDEIKSTFRSLEKMKEPEVLHLAQAKCYAYFYCCDHSLSKISVRMTYVNLDTEEVRRFYFHYTAGELEQWFCGVLEEYKKWAAFQISWRKIRQESIHQTTFPYPYRKGQFELAKSVYQTIDRGKILFIQAPTGVGKTLSVLFPSVKAVGEGKGDKIFYLTARTIARTVASEAFNQLREHNLRYKTVVITAKEKICPMVNASAADRALTAAEEAPENGSGRTPCDPELCPYARGHFDRINDVLYRLVTMQDSFDRTKLLQAAQKYRVCPFELSLDLSLWVDAVICDYNYVFHPRAKLKRFFADTVRGDYLFLADEAHNLVERGRDMYSAGLVREDFVELKRAVSVYGSEKKQDEETSQAIKRLTRALNSTARILMQMKKNCQEQTGAENADHRGVLSTSPENAGKSEALSASSGFEKKYCLLPGIGTLPVSLINLTSAMEDFLDVCDDRKLADQVRSVYFNVNSFLEISGRVDEHYVIYDEILPNRRFMVRLFCVDPSANLQQCLDKARSTIYFSATLLPIDYYKRLLSTRTDNYAVYAAPVFDPGRLKVLIGADISSRYRDRTPQMYWKTAGYIRKIVSTRKGNYLVFFSSYRQMEETEAMFEENCPENTEIIMQRSGMREKDRENFLNRFSETSAKSLVGFCVMGSIFSEGIDLKKDRLIGAIIVGTGLPQVCTGQEILKNYYDKRSPDPQNKEGFRYAYICPGMNKVLQAAGRVIRTEEDYGTVVLLDNRFTQTSCSCMFPREWSSREICSAATVESRLKEFWKKMEVKDSKNHTC